MEVLHQNGGGSGLMHHGGCRGTVTLNESSRRGDGCMVDDEEVREGDERLNL